MAKYPKYQMVIDYVLDKIKSGDLKAGDKIPSESEFSQIMNISNITVRKAMSELVNSGIIYRIKGKGSFVSDKFLQSGRNTNRLVAFMFSDIDVRDNAYIELIISMQKYLMSQNFSLIVECTDGDSQSEISSIKNLLSKNVEGFIIYSKEPKNCIPSYKFLHDNNIPFVLVDRYTPLFPCNFVGSNDHDGAFAATHHLLKLNHTNIAFVGSHLSLSTEQERFAGYKDALASMSLEVNPENCFPDYKVDLDRLVANTKKGGITAFFAVNDHCALKVMNALYSEGIRVPDDVSIVGFGDSEVIKHSMIPLTTVKQFFDEIGYASAKLLVQVINNSSRFYDYAHLSLRTKLIIRDTTRKLSV